MPDPSTLPSAALTVLDIAILTKMRDGLGCMPYELDGIDQHGRRYRLSKRGYCYFNRWKRMRGVGPMLWRLTAKGKEAIRA
jgi:hypothetical protein